MDDQWHYQIRVYLDDAMANLARTNLADPALAPLAAVLTRHDAALVSQYDAFAGYVAEMERAGTTDDPLYRWTKATLANAEHAAKHIGSFSVRVHGQEVYGRTEADAVEADLAALVGGGIVKRMSRHDTNPANNIPVPAEYR